MRPSCCERCAKWFSSCSGSASRSARRPMVRLPSPQRSTPTTPVPAMPVCTSRPHSRSLSATICEVRCSSKPSSGWAWMSRRSATKREMSAKESTMFMSSYVVPPSIMKVSVAMPECGCMPKPASRLAGWTSTRSRNTNGFRTWPRSPGLMSRVIGPCARPRVRWVMARACVATDGGHAASLAVFSARVHHARSSSMPVAAFARCGKSSKLLPCCQMPRNSTMPMCTRCAPAPSASRPRPAAAAPPRAPRPPRHSPRSRWLAHELLVGPVDRVLEHRARAVVVFGRDDDEAVEAWPAWPAQRCAASFFTGAQAGRAWPR
jgi:hypothetical protein